MTIEEAMGFLRNYQKWRTQETDFMPDARKTTVAFDTILEHYDRERDDMK